MKALKGAFVHPCMRTYRADFFSNLSLFFDLDVIETAVPKSGPHVSADRRAAIHQCSARVYPAKDKAILFGRLDFNSFSCLKPKYDFIIFSSFASVPFLVLCLPAKLLGKKIFLFDESWLYPTTWRFKIILPWIRFLVRYCVQGILATGGRAASLSEKLFDKTRVEVVTNCLGPAGAVSVIRQKKKPIIFLGRIEKIKGLDILIRAISVMKKPVALSVYGDGEHRQECEEFVRELELSDWITFHGACEHSRVLEIMSSFEVFVLPSRLQRGQNQVAESWGFVVNEALLAGCKVVASSAVGCAPDLIIDGFNGYIYEDGDSHDLADKIKMALKLSTSPDEITKDLQKRFNNEDNARRVYELIISEF